MSKYDPMPVAITDPRSGEQVPIAGDALPISSAALGATTDVAVVTDAAGTISGKLRGLVKILADVWNSTAHFLGVYSKPNPQTPLAHRTAVTAADVIAAPGAVTCTKQADGSATAGTYYVKVVAGNTYGRTTATAGNTTVTTETTNLTVRAAFAQVTGATFYDIYCSTDADPKWVGRITEAQRASGILITAVGVTGAGGTAGAVDVQVPGTGLQAATTAVVNTAYSIPTPINCAGYNYVDFDIAPTRSGDAVAAALTIAPFFGNSRTSTYFQGQAVALEFGGTAAAYNTSKQRLRVECRGMAQVALVVQQIAGTGMNVDVDYTLS